MAGATVPSTPTKVGASSAADIFTAQTQSPSSANSLRISFVAERLFKILDSSSTAQGSNSMDLFQLCLSLARGIDYAVANNDVPSKAQELPILLKKVCQRKSDYVVHAAVMVLMISVKIACKFQWFTDNDTTELLTIANEIGSSFCSQGNINAEPSLALPTVLNVMARFCPQMKTSQIYASLQINPGYEAYLVDFHIPKNHTGSPKDKIRLFVAQTDSAETSSCLISPPQVNFLLNGKGVEKRTTIVMDTRPQIPTDVTSMLKYGTNLLQVVGQFNGHYLVVIASINITPLPETSNLPDYVPLAVAAQDADAEIIEGRSRISLNCPISCKRIKTPAKGQSCKHFKSFDLDNFLKLNIRTLSWRCPHCGQSTCYQDIRIDQYMAKILRDVGKNVADVIIYEDGTWKPGTESNDHVNTNDNKTISGKNDDSDPQENTTCTDAITMIHDLTEGDDETNTMILSDVEESKPFQANVKKSNDVILPINRESAAPIDDDFWTGIYLSTCNSMSSSAMSNAQTVGHISEMLTEEMQGNTTSMMQNQFTPLNTLQLHPSQVVDSIMTNEYGSFPSIQTNVSRIPIAVQALPAQPTPSLPLVRPGTGFNSLPPNNCSSVLPSSYGFNTLSSGTTDGHQQFSRTDMGHVHMAEMAPSLFQRRAAASQMNLVQRDQLSIPNQSAQQSVNLSAPQLPTFYRHSATVRNEQQNAHQPQAMNQRITQNISHPPNSMIRTPPHLQRTQLPQTGSQPYMGPTNTPVSSNPSATHRAVQMARQAHHTPVQMQPVLPGTPHTANSNGFRSSSVRVPVQPVRATGDLVDISSEQNWRPTGRMRGSLSGQAYSTALSQLITRPSHQTQVARPLANPTSLSPARPPLSQVLLANNRNAHASQTHNTHTNEPDNIIGSLDVVPDQAL